MSDGNIKFKTLLDRIYDSTTRSNIEWKLTDKENPYCVLGDYFVTLSAERDPEGEPLEFVSINDRNGNVVEHFNDINLSQFKPSDRESKFQNYWTLMENLRRMAVRQAKGADKAIEEILSALDEIDVPF